MQTVVWCQWAGNSGERGAQQGHSGFTEREGVCPTGNLLIGAWRSRTAALPVCRNHHGCNFRGGCSLCSCGYCVGRRWLRAVVQRPRGLLFWRADWHRWKPPRRRELSSESGAGRRPAFFWGFIQFSACAAYVLIGCLPLGLQLFGGKKKLRSSIYDADLISPLRLKMGMEINKLQGMSQAGICIKNGSFLRLRKPWA